MTSSASIPRARRVATASIALAALTALATACTHTAESGPTDGDAAPSAAPGRVDVQTGDIDLTITHAVVHLDPAGAGTLTMTVHNGGDAPEHLDMVGAPKGGRGALKGGAGDGNGSMTTAGILIASGSTVTFAGSGPGVRFASVQGVTSAHTLPLVIEFGIAGLVHLDAVVQGS